MAYTVSSVLGYVALGFLADALGRKPLPSDSTCCRSSSRQRFLLTRDLELLLILALINGIFTCGQYSWMPVWMSELYPTRRRGTAIAFGFNAPRFIAFLGPLLSGWLIVHFGGFEQGAMSVAFIYILGIVAALFLPENAGPTAATVTGCNRSTNEREAFSLPRHPTRIQFQVTFVAGNEMHSARVRSAI